MDIDTKLTFQNPRALRDRRASSINVIDEQYPPAVAPGAFPEGDAPRKVHFSCIQIQPVLRRSGILFAKKVLNRQIKAPGERPGIYTCLIISAAEQFESFQRHIS